MDGVGDASAVGAAGAADEVATTVGVDVDSVVAAAASDTSALVDVAAGFAGALVSIGASVPVVGGFSASAFVIAASPPATDGSAAAWCSLFSFQSINRSVNTCFVPSVLKPRLEHSSRRSWTLSLRRVVGVRLESCDETSGRAMVRNSSAKRFD